MLYGGNVGFSQSLDLVLGAARASPDVRFLVNGDGAARASLEAAAADLPNVVFRGYIEPERLSELLATGDIHVVPLKAGLARVSVPSKTYSIMAAGRPVLAAIDPAHRRPSASWRIRVAASRCRPTTLTRSWPVSASCWPTRSEPPRWEPTVVDGPWRTHRPPLLVVRTTR